MKRIVRVFLTGCLAILPLFITVFAAGWLISFLGNLFGPTSKIGWMLTSVGAALGVKIAPYMVGLAILMAAVFALGLLVESRLGPWITNTLEAMVARIPLISNVYDLTKRFTAIVEPKEDTSLTSMRPVWCFFGGEPGAAVLALLPTSELVKIGETDYVGVMVPSAPVPFGGALIYVPSDWVKPAEGGVDELVSVYVSMGVNPPNNTVLK